MNTTSRLFATMKTNLDLVSDCDKYVHRESLSLTANTPYLAFHITRSTQQLTHYMSKHITTSRSPHKKKPMDTFFPLSLQCYEISLPGLSTTRPYHAPSRSMQETLKPNEVPQWPKQQQQCEKHHISEYLMAGGMSYTQFTAQIHYTTARHHSTRASTERSS